MPLTNDRNSDHPNDHQLVPVSKAIYAYTMDILRRYSSDGYPPEDIQAMDSIRRSAFTNGAFMGSVVGTTSYLIGKRASLSISENIKPF